MRLILFVVLFTGVLSCPAQDKEVNRTLNWYFGNLAGLRFEGCGDALPGNEEVAEAPCSKMMTKEGVCAMSDLTGRLLFYANGERVYNRDHEIMRNGDSLSGSFSSAQGCLAVPQPGRPNLYYLFTTEDRNQAGPLCYSIIDMAADEGRGAVTRKNVSLGVVVEEKIAGVRHTNGVDYWMVARKWMTNEFYAWRVTRDSLTQPVISKMDLSWNKSTCEAGVKGQGTMCISPDGRRLALVQKDCFVQVFDFDPAKGRVSPEFRYFNTFAYPFGVAFSPDGTKLYVSESRQFTPGRANALCQYDLLEPDSARARTKIAHRTVAWGAIQLGPDGKLYLARDFTDADPQLGMPPDRELQTTGLPFLDVIHQPNVRGTACEYEADAVELGECNDEQGLILFRRSRLGLPNFISSWLAGPKK